MSSSTQLVRVAVPVPLADAFDYLAPAGALPAPGCRVRVPFGRGERIGIVVDHPAATDVAPDRLKAIGSVLDASPALGAELLQSLRWAAEYYHHPLGTVLTHALPGLLREGRAIDEPPEPAWQLTALGTAQDLARLPRTHRQQSRALAALRARALTARRAQDARRRRRHDRTARGQGLGRARGAAGTPAGCSRARAAGAPSPSSPPISAASSLRSRRRRRRARDSAAICCTA